MFRATYETFLIDPNELKQKELYLCATPFNLLVLWKESWFIKQALAGNEMRPPAVIPYWWTYGQTDVWTYGLMDGRMDKSFWRDVKTHLKNTLQKNPVPVGIWACGMHSKGVWRWWANEYWTGHES